MKTERTVILTHELIQAGSRTKPGSEFGAWTRKQLAILGVPLPPTKGWKTKLVQNRTEISKADYARFLALGGRKRKFAPLNGFFARTPAPTQATGTRRPASPRLPSCLMCSDPARPESSYCEVCWENLIAKTKVKKKLKSKTA